MCVGAMVAGLLLGMIEILSSAYIGTTERDFFSFAILILILLYRPTGLFGTRTTEERWRACSTDCSTAIRARC